MLKVIKILIIAGILQVFINRQIDESLSFLILVGILGGLEYLFDDLKKEEQ